MRKLTQNEIEIVRIFVVEKDGLTFEEFASLLSVYSLQEILNAFDYVQNEEIGS